MSGSKGQAAELVETMLTFIEQVSNRKLRFSSIVDLNTGKTSDPTDRLVFAIDAALRAAKVEGLREAAEMVEDDCYIEGGELLPDYKHRCKHNVNQKELAGKIRFRANDLAQQAQDEKGVGDVHG